MTVGLPHESVGLCPDLQRRAPFCRAIESFGIGNSSFADPVMLPWLRHPKSHAVLPPVVPVLPRSRLAARSCDSLGKVAHASGKIAQSFLHASRRLPCRVREIPCCTLRGSSHASRKLANGMNCRTTVLRQQSIARDPGKRRSSRPEHWSAKQRLNRSAPILIQGKHPAGGMEQVLHPLEVMLLRMHADVPAAVLTTIEINGVARKPGVLQTVDRLFGEFPRRV